MKNAKFCTAFSDGSSIRGAMAMLTCAELPRMIREIENLCPDTEEAVIQVVSHDVVDTHDGTDNDCIRFQATALIQYTFEEKG